MKHDILEGTSNKSSFPGSALFANSNPKKCVFRQSVDHYSDKCNTVTEIDKRRQLLKSNRLCFNCLRGDHTKKNCRKQIKCFKCKTEVIIPRCATRYKNKLKVMSQMILRPI